MTAPIRPLALGLLSVSICACGGGGGGGAPPVAPTPTNNAPTITPPSNVTGSSGVFEATLDITAATTLTFTASDPDGDAILWNAIALSGSATPPGLSFPTTLPGNTFTIDVTPVTAPTDETVLIAITDGRQNTAEASVRILREAASQPTAPQLVGAPRYRDVTQDGAVNAGDQILLRFDQAIDLTNAQIGDLEIEPGTSGLGAGATVIASSRSDELAIELGTNPSLKVRGRFDPANVTATSPSALRVRAAQVGIVGAVGALPATGSAFVGLYPAFEPIGSFGSSTNARAAATADLNFDGFVDVVLATDDGVEIIDTDATLGGATGISARLAAGTPYTSVALVDLDYDGQLDIAASSTTECRIFRNSGNGAFTVGQSLFGAPDVVALTSDNSGFPAIVTLGPSGSSFRAYFNNGLGSLAVRSSTVFPGSDQYDAQCLLVANVTRTGLDDLIAGGGPDQPTTVWRRDQSNIAAIYQLAVELQLPGDPGGAPTPRTVALGSGDMDGDGTIDVVEGNAGSANRVWFQGGPLRYVSFGDAAQTVSIEVVDLDRDGDLDIVEGIEGAPGRVWLNDGTGNTYLDARDELSDGALCLADLDLDGDLEVVGGSSSGANLSFGTAGSLFGPVTWEVTPQQLNGPNFQSLDYADMNGDGVTDIVQIYDGNVRIWLGDRANPGTFTLGLDANDLGAQEGAVIGDIDRDGTPDIAYSFGFLTSVVRVRLDPLNGGRQFDLSLAAAGAAVTAIALADMNLDGSLDIVACGNAGTSSGVAIFENDRRMPGMFTSGAPFAVNTDILNEIEIADINMDGSPDFVACSDARPLIHVATQVDRNPLTYQLDFTFTTTFNQDIAGIELADMGSSPGQPFADGRIDLVVALENTTSAASAVEIWYHTPAAPYFAVPPVPTFNPLTGSFLQGLDLGDVDGDGVPNVISTSLNANRVLIGDLFANTPVELIGGRFVQTVDLDGDGDLDLVCGPDASNQNAIYLNR